MKRIDLINSLKMKVETEAWDFRHGFVGGIPSGGITDSMWWCCPLKLIASVSNYNEQFRTYRLISYLFLVDNAFTEDEREQKWQEMEDSAQNVYDGFVLDKDPVSGFVCSPQETDVPGTICLKVLFNVRIYHCNEYIALD